MIASGATRTEPGASTYAGLFFTTLSTLMYEILLTRIFSVTMWYHFAFVAVSVALFGLTVGALIVHLAPSSFTQERVRERLLQASLLFSVSMVLSFLTQLAIPFDPRWTVVSVYSVAFTYLVISVPFVFSGITVCLVLTRFPTHVSRLYAVDLVGAGLGTVTLIWLLNLLQDGPSAVLGVAALAGCGALVFGLGVPASRMRFVALGAVVLFAGLAIGNGVAAQNTDAFITVRFSKGSTEQGSLYDRWNAYSRVRAYGFSNVPVIPFGWGFSSRLPIDSRARQIYLNIDSAAGTVMTYYDGNPDSVRFLAYDVTNMAHYLRSDGDVLVIGSGGGRDVLTALYFRQHSVKAVEINTNILKVVNEEYGDFTGHLDRQPGVMFVNDEARSYLARSDEQFDILQLSLIDTWAATGAGAFALSENSLYTVEAWETFLDRLKPGGVLSVSRWYRSRGPMETHRTVALAAEVLRRRGVEDPREHMLLVKSPYTAFGAAVGTLLVSNEPFTAADVKRMQDVTAVLDFELILAPAPLQSHPIFQRIAEAPRDGAAKVNFPGDISAPTDNRPFFFQMLHFQDIFNKEVYGGLHNFVTQPVLVLFSLSISVLALTALCIVLPLLLTTSREALRGSWLLVLFFCAIGMGFLLLEIAQMQRLTIFLGHPTYSLSVVLFSLLIFSGLGSLTTEWLASPKQNPGLRPTLLAPLLILLPVLIVFGFVTPNVVHDFDDKTTVVRILISVGILAPMGFLMGMPFPLGMKVASLRPNAPTAFFWGINGATSVCASVLAIAIALGWGISTSFWAGSFCYAIAAAALGLVVLRGRAAT